MATCVIFDQDETVIEKETHYEACFAIMAKIHSLNDQQFDPASALRREVMGVSWEGTVIPRMIETFDMDLSVSEYNRQSIIIMNELSRFAGLMHGARKLIRHLSIQGVPIAIATSCEEARIAPSWQNNQDVYELFNAVVAGDDHRVKNGKPDPDLLFAAANDLVHEPTDCIYVGDNRVDLDAARAAGMRFVAVPNYLRTPEDFPGADYIIDSLEGFPLAELGLPSM